MEDKAAEPPRNRRHERGRRFGRGQGTSRSSHRVPRSERRPIADRAPPHLHGREIGMFYAKRNKQKKIDKMKRSYGTILMSAQKKEQILKTLDSITLIKMDNSDGSYDNVESSEFKYDFLRIINQSIDDKLQFARKTIVGDETLDEVLYSEHLAKKSNEKYLDMLKKRQQLPSYNMQQQVIELIENNQVSIITGETGCGKTTQVAQFIVDHYIEAKRGSECRVICTQPRRISAISVAERVADERAEGLGHSVGYQIRLEHQKPRDRASICYCTTGIVLKQMEGDAALSNVSHLILDEIHERDILSDFILALVKKVQVYRPDLKIVLMSATLNCEKFIQYFQGAPHLNIPGFTFPVQEYYLEDVLEKTRFKFPPADRRSEKDFRSDDYVNYILPHVRKLEDEKQYSRHTCDQLRNPVSEKLNIYLIVDLIHYICTTAKDDGAILVFLTGFQEISNLIQQLEESGRYPPGRFCIYALHSLMPTLNQKQIFQVPPKGVRKIVVATNIAETSITIDDVVYVIDAGWIKLSNFDVETNSKTLAPRRVSLANAQQRKGRAGRVKPGVCYYLFSKVRKMLLDKEQLPEILRSRCEQVILTLKILQLGKVQEFFRQLIDSPDEETTACALDLLKRMDAITEDENLTPLGYHLAKLPVAPQMGKMMLYGALFSCLDPILSIAVTLDFKDPFQLPLFQQEVADRCRQELAEGTKSDHLLYWNVLRKFEELENGRSFCNHYFLNYQTMKLLVNMKNQFMQYLHEMKFVDSLDPKEPDFNQNSENLSLVKAIICAGLYPNVALSLDDGKAPRLTLDGNGVKFHGKSVLSREKHFSEKLLVYYEKIKSSRDFIFDATLVHPLPIVLFGDKFSEFEEEGHHSVTIAQKLRFKCTKSTAAIILRLRETFSRLLEYKISHPGPVRWFIEDDTVEVLKIMKELITMEGTGEIDHEAYDDYD